ncbi:TPA: phenylacetate--CoA ligase [Candidatus Sumerlaeota bacterium]|nr:phenylacetate--CoA ligase [Candidatus Sumerlaeota bacterium]
MSILDPKPETAQRDDLRQIQLERLQATLNRAYRNVLLYREKFNKAGVLPEQVRSLEDLACFPRTTREDLLAHQPFGLFAVPLHDVVRLHPAAGAGGPVVVGYTHNDIAVWTRMAARALTSAGVTKEDVVQISLDYAQDAAGMGAQSAAELLGASVIPASGLAPKRQAELLKNYRVTVLIATPNQALHLAQTLGSEDPAPLSLRSAFLVAHAWTPDLHKEIEERLQIKTYASYGLSEMTEPGLATECGEHNGLHLSEDNFLAEILDPETGAPLAAGQAGELTLTTLTREATPLIRYRTGCLAILHPEPCACGRTLQRIELVSGRIDNIVTVEGVRLTLEQVQEVVNDLLPGAPCNLAVLQEDGAETLEVRIAIDDPSLFADQMKHMQALREHIKAHLFEHLGLWTVVRLVEQTREEK